MTRSSARCALVLFALAALMMAGTVAAQSPAGPQGVWFDSFKAPPPLVQADEEALVRYMTEKLSAGRTIANQPTAALKQDQAGRIVILSVSDGQSPARVVVGAGQGVLAAADQAIARLSALWPDRSGYEWFKVDLVRDCQPVRRISPDTPLPFDPSLLGIAFDRASGLALTPEQLTAGGLADSHRAVDWEALADYFKDSPALLGRQYNAYALMDAPLYGFDTDSYFSDGLEVARLHRGHRLFPQVTPELLLQSATAAGEYLKNLVGPDGRFACGFYDPRRSVASKDYSLAQHAAAAEAMLWLYLVNHDPELLDAARRAVQCLAGQIKPIRVGEVDASCVVEDEKVDLGTVAQAAIALVRYTQVAGDRQYVPAITGLGQWMRATQERNGHFRVHVQTWPAGKALPQDVPAYQSQAALALARIFLVAGDQRWLDASESAMRYLMVQSNQREDPSGGHWLLQALEELQLQRPNDFRLDLAMQQATAIAKQQNRQSADPDLVGGFGFSPSAAYAATRCQTLAAACRMARDFGRGKEAADLLESLKLGVAFQLQTQFRPESAIYLKDPQRVLGAFHEGLTNQDVQLNSIRHNLSAIVDLYRLLAPQQPSP